MDIGAPLRPGLYLIYCIVLYTQTGGLYFHINRIYLWGIICVHTQATMGRGPIISVIENRADYKHLQV